MSKEIHIDKEALNADIKALKHLSEECVYQQADAQSGRGNVIIALNQNDERFLQLGVSLKKLIDNSVVFFEDLLTANEDTDENAAQQFAK